METKNRAPKGSVKHEKIDVNALLENVEDKLSPSEREYSRKFTKVYKEVRMKLVIIQKGRSGAHSITNEEAVEMTKEVLTKALENL